MKDFDQAKQSSQNNIVFIDGQNLYLGTKELGWRIDTARLRVYLKDKYHIQEAYYFFGFFLEKERELYESLQRQGYILSFREHSLHMTGKKKGNVDCDIIFSAMKAFSEENSFDKIFIISGDGDYKRLVDYLIKRGKFGKILFPNKQDASSLYKRLGGEYFGHLDDPSIREKIEYRKMKKAP